jgi:hypothetical protein
MSTAAECIEKSNFFLINNPDLKKCGLKKPSCNHPMITKNCLCFHLSVVINVPDINKIDNSILFDSTTKRLDPISKNLFDHNIVLVPETYTGYGFKHKIKNNGLNVFKWYIYLVKYILVLRSNIYAFF